MASTAKKLINFPKDVVEESVQGLLLINPSLIRIEGMHVLLRRDFLHLKNDLHHVALLSGGGSGHEPAHAGFIGQGMLTSLFIKDSSHYDFFSDVWICNCFFSKIGLSTSKNSIV